MMLDVALSQTALLHCTADTLSMLRSFACVAMTLDGSAQIRQQMARAFKMGRGI